MRSSPIAFVGSNGQAPVSFVGSFPVSHGVTESPIGSVGLSDIVDVDTAVNSVLEAAINGTPVGITASAIEAGHTVEYTLTVNPGGLFAIGLTTGVVTKAAALDAETAVSHDITVLATSSSGKTKDRIFSIAVSDANEFTVGAITDTNAATNEVLESAANGTPVGITAQATDADVTDTVTFDLTDDAGGRFAIDANTGIVTVADTGLLDFETATSHDITVRATSTDMSSSTQPFTITVLNDATDDGLVPAARFEGTNDALRRAANPTGVVDGINGTFAIPVKMMGGDTTLQYIWSNATGSYIRRNADGTVEALFADAASVDFVKIISTSTLRVADGWTMLLVNPAKMYFGNTDETGTRTTGAAADIDWTSGFNWGEDSAAGNLLNAELARPWLALEAYDLTVQLNREAFFTSLSPLTLADIKTNGSGPTGSAALDFLPNGFTAFSQNAGTGGGNFSIVGGLTEGAGPAGAVLTSPSFVAGAVAVAIADNDSASTATNLFSADQDQVVCSFWYNPAGAAPGVDQNIFSTGGLAISRRRNTGGGSNQIRGHFRAGAPDIRSDGSTSMTGDQWFHILLRGRNDTAVGGGLGSAEIQMYVDDVAETVSENLNDIGSTQFDMTDTATIFRGLTDGYLAEVIITSEDLDITLEANRRKFISVAGKPVDLGSDGTLSGLIQPECYLSGGASAFLTNKGNGPDFDTSITGTLTDAPSSPSD